MNEPVRKLDLGHWIRTWRQICKQTSENKNCEFCKKRNGNKAKSECDANFQAICRFIEKGIL
jgi:hypothetical protein